MTRRLATTSVTSRLSGQHGRAIVAVRGHHFVVDSPLSLGGPNEEVNPIDLLLSALAAHGTFVCERAAQEMNIPLHSVSITTVGDFDPRGVTGEPVDPSLQSLHVRLTLSGPTDDQGEALADAIRTRCPVYATLARCVPIQLEVVGESVVAAR
jgi:uncharacterized OsmC-like protein